MAAVIRRLSVCALLAPAGLMSAAAAAEPASDAKQKAIQQDRKRIEGTWRIVTLTVNGNQAADQDAQKLTVKNGSDGTWTLFSAGSEISKGTSTFDPTQKPKSIDFTPTEGAGKGNQYLGIYKIGKTKRSLCFAPPGQDRPTEFSSSPGSQHILVVFEREGANNR